MKTLSTILLLIIVLSLSAKPKPCIGYWIVTYDIQRGYNVTPTIELVDVYTVAETYFPNNCIDFNKQFKKSVYFEMESDRKSFYVEVKKINANGKFKKLSKKEIKEYLK